LGKRFVDGKLGRVVPVPRDEGAERAVLAESEDAGFAGAGAFETPVIFGYGLGEFDLQRTDGLEGIADAGAVFLEGLVLVGSEDADLAGEAVTISVEAVAILAFFGFGATQ
jgi:hypothetical protein